MSNFLRLLLQNLFGQIVKNIVVATGKVADEAGDTGSIQALQRQRRQVQASAPTLGASLQLFDLLRWKWQRLNLEKESSHFVQGEAQVGGAQFGQLAVSSQPSQGQGWVSPAGNDQTH